MKINEIENNLLSEFDNIIGIDEAGRGPWAGPVTVGAILLDKVKLERISEISYLNDSKKLSPKKRGILEKEILEITPLFSIKDIDAEIIDNINILEATKLGILECLEDVLTKGEIKKVGILIDGKFNNIENIISQLAIFKDIEFKVLTVVDGDALCPSIAAASILAKEHRDRLMYELHKKYPEYAFDKHKGYGTKVHMERLKLFGPSEIHRKSFAPIKNLLLD